MLDFRNNAVQNYSCLHLFSYLALRKPNEAASVLTRRLDCQALKAASYITLVAGEMNAFKNFSTRFIQECQTVGDWQAAAEVLSWHKSMKVNILLIVNVRFHRKLIYGRP